MGDVTPASTHRSEPLRELVLRLRAFRCHPTLELALSPGRTLLVGSNGCGKTSILEALYLVGRLRSFRTQQPRELLSWGADALYVEARLDQGSPLGPEALAYIWKDGARRLEHNGSSEPSAAAFWGRLPVVLFSSADRLLVAGPAAIRRRWIDALLALRDPGYLLLARRYQRALSQRNATLRARTLDTRLLSAISEQLNALGREVTATRAALLPQIQQTLRAQLQALGGPNPASAETASRLETIYKQGNSADASSVHGRALLERERRMGATLTGPHRDEWALLWDGKPLARFGSEGEQRLAALALRLAEATLIERARGCWPVLLLDDVLAPLDAVRRERFLAQIPAAAISLFAAPTLSGEDSDGLAAPARIYSVEPGQVREISQGA